ncbi:acetyl-CoA hydrolase/transferase family protein [Solibacillus merdavium]|uniref:Acetyl-CoA hydrolase/transferase family protein n=1 Tax=Solibacillus merdavium TaxID=2762218 RepID=A0ABR8XKA2_9BACL|nr:acetyl-CoA hydrolase/transferase family protein [Solibacillus merdavium]MBD8032349.1 acetyl-CoA hydrolase/transferase family protein [Solibacillus merdavium]
MIDLDWKDIYRKRFTTTEKAVQHIESFQKIFLAPMCNEPQALVEELIRQKSRLQEISLYTVVLGSPCKYADIACHPHFNIRTFLSSPLLKKAYENKKCDYLPVNFSEIPRWIKEEHIDVALIQVSPPNADGFCNLGLSVDVVPTLIKEAKIVIAEVNSNLPVTFGETLVHVSEINFFVHSDRSLLTIRNSQPSEEDLKIGRYVATLIPEYATIQVGVGKIASGIIQSLHSKVGLGVHSGSISDDIMELINIGVVTNERKEINRNRTVCTTLTGTNDLYEFCHRNEYIELYPINYTHNAAVISKISNFHSINSAMEVSLSGQINAEQIDENHVVAGVGGQMDFIRASKLSPGGRAIIAMPSTAQFGMVSRIKAHTQYVTSLKSDVDYVVTEYGIAKLFGKSMKERAESLIAIAHPKFRTSLLEEFEQLQQ